MFVKISNVNMSNTPIFLLKKCEELLQCKAPLILSTKNISVFGKANDALNNWALGYHNVPRFLGPVVQSIVSLTSSLRGHLVKCFTTS